ncbi:AIR synthase-related protein [Enterobacter hormaechei]
MAANMLGVDVINLANEGCLCLFVEPDSADEALALLRTHPLGQNAAIVGEVLPTIEPKVTMLEPDGTLSTIEELYGAELPRLC